MPTRFPGDHATPSTQIAAKPTTEQPSKLGILLHHLHDMPRKLLESAWEGESTRMPNVVQRGTGQMHAAVYHQSTNHAIGTHIASISAAHPQSDMRNEPQHASIEHPRRRRRHVCTNTLRANWCRILGNAYICCSCLQLSRTGNLPELPEYNELLTAALTQYTSCLRPQTPIHAYSLLEAYTS